MKSYTLTVKKEFSQEDIDNILDSALNCCSFWCDEASVKKAPDEPTNYMSEMLTRGGELRFKIDEPYEEGGKKSFVLTESKFVKALEKYMQDNGTCDVEDFDGPMADSVLQIALFGSDIYG